ncbi:O-antigen ligase family protein [Halomonas aquamarina]|uniref:O-antigen ligase family protein n=1 Tax=Vreelandella aquamarina TaxID=77097 RepID=A0ACC5VQ85_9GAMM|nr:hypothetical protein [Halomonas aquamarina]MBZ5486431.1 O-antigen ligase family protein [Halomonas aquamarina]
MDVKLKKCFNLILLGFLLLWPAVDTLNGYFYYQDASFVSISAPYKAVGFIFIVILMLLYYPYRFFQFLLLVATISFCLIYQIAVYEEISESVAWAVRGLLTMALLLYLISEKGENVFWTRKKIVNLMLFYFFVMAVNVALGVAGVGESQYAGGIGGKGFIIAGNEMSYLMLASASVVLFHTSIKKNVWILIAVFLAFFLFFLMKATKAAMLGVLLIFFFSLVFNGFFKVKRLPVIYGTGLLVGLAALVLGYQFIQSTGLLDRIQYLYKLHDGFWGALLSGRVAFVQDAFYQVISHFNVADAVLGIGVDELRRIRGSIVEIDVIDVFITFGLVGPIIFYLPWIMGLFWSVGLMSKNLKNGACFVLLLLTLIGVSLTAGHVVNSGIASSATAFLMYYIYLNKRESVDSQRRNP